jgi:hypothetical protein
MKLLAEPHESLLEFINGRGLQAAIIEQTGVECRRLLNNFLSIWPEFKDREIVYVDNPDDYPGYYLCGNHGIYARPDLVISNGNKYLLVNWKTGEEPDDYSDNELEMAMSIFLACFDYNGASRARPEDFEGIFYYLPTQKKSHKIVKTKDEFEQMADSIDEKLHQLPESLIEAHYIPDPAKWKCKPCNFATICHDGRQLLDL